MDERGTAESIKANVYVEFCVSIKAKEIIICLFSPFFKVFNEDDAEMSRDIDSVNMTKMPFICLSKNAYKNFLFFLIFFLS